MFDLPQQLDSGGKETHHTAEELVDELKVELGVTEDFVELRPIPSLPSQIRASVIGQDTGVCHDFFLVAEPSDFIRSTEEEPCDDGTQDGLCSQEDLDPSPSGESTGPGVGIPSDSIEDEVDDDPQTISA